LARGPARLSSEGMKRARRLLPAGVLLHTELLDEHVLVEERGGRYELSGLIDFADGRVGPAEYDFPAPVEFLFRGQPGLLGFFLRAYGYARTS